MSQSWRGSQGNSPTWETEAEGLASRPSKANQMLGHRPGGLPSKKRFEEQSPEVPEKVEFLFVCFF